MLEALSYRGRRCAGFGLGAPPVIDTTVVLSTLGFDPKTVQAGYEAQQGGQKLATVFGKYEQLSADMTGCQKNCAPGDNACLNDCNAKTFNDYIATLSAVLATASLVNPVIGLVGAALIAIVEGLKSIFGLASSVGDPRCPNGPLSWPPAQGEQATWTGPDGKTAFSDYAAARVKAMGVSDPFVMSVWTAILYNEALILNCHWDHAMGGSGSIALVAVMLDEWNRQHAGPAVTITRTVAGNGPPPADYDQWTQIISWLYFAENPNGKEGDQASIVVNMGPRVNLSGNVISVQGGPPSSPAKKLFVGTVVVAGAGAAGVGILALYKGVSYAQAWRDVKRKVVGH